MVALPALRQSKVAPSTIAAPKRTLVVKSSGVDKTLSENLR